MELGSIVFYRHYDRFQDILTHMSVKEQSLCISDESFTDYYGYDRQSLFHVLYQSNDMWGFVCRIIKRKDGGTAYKIINSNNKVNQINEDEIYFILSMDDFTFTHWAEMENDKKILRSSQGTVIMKKPSSSTIKLCKAIKQVFGLGQNMLYQIVSLENGSPSYPSSNPINSQWEKYDPYKPKEGAFERWYQYSMTGNLPPWVSNNGSNPYQNLYAKGKTTLHAVPFLRDNIKPTTFRVVGTIKSYENDLKMFINFPTGLPIRFE